MKTSYPYFTTSLNQIGCIPVKNNSDASATSNLILKDFMSGIILKTIAISLPAKAGMVYTRQNDLAGLEGRHLSIDLIGSEFITMHPFMIPRVDNTPTVTDAFATAALTGLVPKVAQIKSTANFKYVGSQNCSYLKSNIIAALDSVIASVIKDVPGTKPFVMGNACPITGACPDNGSHCTQSEVDFDYPTYSGVGTQYGGWERIWLDNDPEKMHLDESKVNWKAIWQFIIRLKRLCTVPQHETQIIIHEKIFALIVKNITHNDMTLLNGIVTQDMGLHLNHHTHMHLKIRLK